MRTAELMVVETLSAHSNSSAPTATPTHPIPAHPTPFGTHVQLPYSVAHLKAVIEEVETFCTLALVHI
jgi:hypothetical protein